MGLLTSLLTNRMLLKAIWVLWIILPYPVRKRVTTDGIRTLLYLKRVMGIYRQADLTPPKKIFTLSFWGVPRLDPEQFSLTVDRQVAHPLSLSFNDLKSYPVVNRQVTLDCVGGLRNIMTMRGVSLASLLESAEPMHDADTAVFHCACLLYTSPSPRDGLLSRMPSSA